MATATQRLPNIQQTSNMKSYAAIVNQKQAQVSNPTEDVPIELNDHRMKNKLFLIHPDLLEKLEYTYTPPPPQRRFKFQCLQDFINWNLNKYKDHFDDDDDGDDHYNDVYNEDRLYETPRFNDGDDYDDYNYDYDYDSENEKDVDIEH